MIIREKNLREKTHKYDTDDLIDKVNQSLLTDKSKSILVNLIDDISVQYSELYHQLSRQSLAVDIYRTYADLNNKFALFIFNCVSSETIDNSVVNHQVNSQIGLLHTLCEKVCNVVQPDIYEKIKETANQAEILFNKFKNECNAIIVNNRSIYYNDTNIDDFLKPKSYKYAVDLSDDEDEDEEKELDNDPDFDLGEVDLDDTQTDDNVRMVSLKQNGLKIRPKKRTYRFRYM